MRCISGITCAIVVLLFVGERQTVRGQNPNRSYAFYGVGVGVGVGVWPYGNFGFFPSAYSSSWSNGFTLYGPPVPTYGAVPGAFGGYDQRISNFRYGYAALYADKFHAPPQGEGLVRPTYIQFELTVPDVDADVTVNSIPLKSKGTQRTFRATGVVPNADNLFTFHVRWSVEGRTYRQDREVLARAGTTVKLDLRVGDALPEPRPLPR